MKKSEFLIRLQEALEGDVGTATIKENIRYYDEYISGEVIEGRNEEEVIAELGDPWILARNVSQAPEVLEATRIYDGEERNSEHHHHGRTGFTQIRVFNSWWILALILLCFVLVVIALVVIVLGILRFLAPVLIPLGLILLVLWLLRNARRR